MVDCKFLCLNRATTQNLTISTTKSKEDNKTVKLLVLTIENSLNWDPHISDLSNQISKCISLLHKVKAYSDKTTLTNIFHGLLQSHISYRIFLWANIKKDFCPREKDP